MHTIESPPAWITRVAAALGVAVRATRPLDGGCVAEVHRVDLADGARAVAKVGGRLLEREARMLRALAAAGLPVPEVLHAAPDLLVMGFVEGESRFDAAAERHAAELLAALHAHTAPTFGFPEPTLIGGLHQPNPAEASWARFYGEHRIGYMAREAERVGHLGADQRRRIERVADRLPSLVPPAPPALLHGDVWTTNVLARGGRITAFLDPAVYYGHPEVELAFIALFSTFGRPFYDAYQALRPLEPGFFEARCALHQLYPLLVHARLFGGGYGAQADAIARRFAG